MNKRHKVIVGRTHTDIQKERIRVIECLAIHAALQGTPEKKLPVTHRKPFDELPETDSFNLTGKLNTCHPATLFMTALRIKTKRENDNCIFDDADAVIAIAQQSFARAAKMAVADNDRLGISTHGSIGNRLVVHHPNNRHATEIR